MTRAFALLVLQRKLELFSDRLQVFRSDGSSKVKYSKHNIIYNMFGERESE